MKEIEILVEVKSAKEKAMKALEQFEFKGAKKILDVYFFDPLRDDLQQDELGKLKASFRLRLEDGKSSITYKTDYFNGAEWSHSDEYETEIKDFETMSHIVKRLGFVELVRVENEKQVYKTSEYEIVLEDVSSLGIFLEVEKLAHVPNEEISEAKEEIRSFIKSLDIEFGEEQNAGKPELILKKV